jgi:hypothetical protein
MAKIRDRVSCLSGLISSSILCLVLFRDVLVRSYDDFDDLTRKKSRVMGAFRGQWFRQNQ